MPGPPPKAEGGRKKRRASPGFRQLPHEGRTGDPPEWPISEPGVEEIAVWTEAWKMPQAVEWERLGWTRTVARYVRAVLEAEKPLADSALRSETRQLEDRLGLTPMAMLRLRWEIADPEAADEEKPSTEDGRRSRPEAVDPDAVARS